MVVVVLQSEIPQDSRSVIMGRRRKGEDGNIEGRRGEWGYIRYI